MISRIALIVTGLLTLSILSSAQQVDHVILNNGTTIRGQITEMETGGIVVINDLAGNTWVYKMSEVDKVKRTYYEQSSPILPEHRGWVNMTSIGFLAGSQQSQYIAPFSMQTSFGYKYISGLYTGLSTGIEFLNINHIPIMADLQYTLRNEGLINPVTILKVGYTFPSVSNNDYYGTTNTFNGGLCAAAGMGLKIRKEEKFAWDISILYRYMRINYSEEYEYQSTSNSYLDVYNRLELRLGVYLGI
ncbi:MAG: hypothetical protein K9J30_09935 [Bacteroidales bacterium]|nr:hypothetical protein [Bacteroidales bacterium]